MQPDKIACILPNRKIGPNMALRLHNSLTRRVEPFTPTDPGRVTMYLCVPTVDS